MSVPKKEFVMTHILENLQDIKVNEEQSTTEDHFNIPWKLYCYRRNECLSFFLKCMKPSENYDWSIDAEFELKLISTNGSTMTTKHKRCFGNGKFPETNAWGWYDLIQWKDLEDIFMVDKKVTIEVQVKIKKMTGFGKENLRHFDESVKKFSDVALIVEEKKFFVLKSYLPLQSTYFNSLLLGEFKESKQAEVVLKDINPEDFQCFLELIHGESSIDDHNVDGILHLADIYDAPTAIRRCGEFLVNESKWTTKEKLELSIRYNLANLKDKCLSEIKTVDDVQSVLPSDIKELDPFIATNILQKQTDAISNQNWFEQFKIF